MPDHKMTFAAEVAPTSWDPADGSLGVIAYAGAVVDRMDWMTGERYSMVLDVTPEAVDLSRFDTGAAPLIDSHWPEEVREYVLGTVIPGSCAIADGKLTCRVKLSVDPAKAGVVADMAAGVIRNFSVGFDILAKEVTEATPTAPRSVRVTRWQPFELSAVAVAADPGAQSFAKEGKTMELVTTPAPALDADKLRQEGAAAERERLAAIDAAGKATKVPANLIDKAKADGISADAARAQFIAHLADEGNKTATAPGLRIEVGPTASEKLHAGAVDYLLHKANPGKAAFALTNEAQRFRGRRAADVARMYLAAKGVDVDGWNDRKALEKAFFAHSTSDFPDLLGDAIGKSLLAAYAELPKQYLPFCAQVAMPGLYDLKPIVMSGVSQLDDVAEGADYPEVALTESQETISSVKGGQIIAVTMEALLKDNLDAFSRLPAAQAAAAVRRENLKIAALFSPNTNHGSTMADGIAVFNASHSNLIASGGAAPSATTLDATELLIANQTGLDGEKLGLEGAVIVVPRALLNTAEQLFSPRYVPTSASGVVSDRQARMALAGFNYLSSAKIWYVFANPNIAPAILFGYPDNADPLSLSIEESFKNDTRKYKATHWFACGWADHRGAAMNPGE